MVNLYSIMCSQLHSDKVQSVQHVSSDVRLSAANAHTKYYSDSPQSTTCWYFWLIFGRKLHMVNLYSILCSQFHLDKVQSVQHVSSDVLLSAANAHTKNLFRRSPKYHLLIFSLNFSIESCVWSFCIRWCVHMFLQLEYRKCSTVVVTIDSRHTYYVACKHFGPTLKTTL